MHCSGIDGIKGGVIDAIVSISIEQNEELGCEALDSVVANDVGVRKKTTTLSMTHKKTRKIVTTAYSSGVCPLDVNAVITFDDEPNGKVINKKSINGVVGTMKRNKRKLKANSEIQGPKKHLLSRNNVLPDKNSISMFNFDACRKEFDNKNEVNKYLDRGQTCGPESIKKNQELQSFPSSEIMCNTSLTDNNKDNDGKEIIKNCKKKMKSKRGANFTLKKSKRTSNVKKGPKRVTSSDITEENKGLEKLPVLSTSMKPIESVPLNLMNHDVNSTEDPENMAISQHKIRQTLCFLNDNQIESLFKLNINSLEEVVHLTLWQLNSIGINKATQLESLLTTLLPGEYENTCKMLPREMNSVLEKKSCEKSSLEIQKEDDNYEDNPLVIDETDRLTINEEPKMTSNTLTHLNNSIMPVTLPINIDENDIRKAAKEIAERIENIKTSNAECTVKKQELMYILERLNELENQDKILKICKSEKYQKLGIANTGMLLDPSNGNENNTSKCELLTPTNPVTDEEKISALNAQDKYKDQSESMKLSEISRDDKFRLDFNELSKPFTTPTKKEIGDPMTRAEGTVDKSIDTNGSENYRKSLQCNKLILTPESSTMTLRSQRKIVNINMISKTPSKNKTSPKTYLSQPKVVINQIKPRRLKLPKRSLAIAENNSHQVLEKTHLLNVSEESEVNSSESDNMNTSAKDAIACLLGNGQTSGDSTNLSLKLKGDSNFLNSNTDVICDAEDKNRIKQRETPPSPTKFLIDGLDILDVNKKEDIQNTKNCNVGTLEELPNVSQKSSTHISNYKNEDKLIASISTNSSIIRENDEAAKKLGLRLSSEEMRENEKIEKDIVLNSGEEKQNDVKEILDQSNKIEIENVREEQRCSDSDALEQNVANKNLDEQSKKIWDAISDEENWDNIHEDNSVQVRRQNKNKFNLERKSYKANSFPEKRQKYNDSYHNSNKISHGYNNNSQKAKHTRNNGYQRGSNCKYEWGEQINNAETYKQPKHNDHYSGKQFNGNDCYNKRKIGFTDDSNGRQASNIKKYTVEQRCSENRGPYQVKYDSDEDWDKTEPVESSTNISSSPNNKTRESSNYEYNNKNNDRRDNVPNKKYEKEKFNTEHSMSRNSFGNQAHVDERRKEKEGKKDMSTDDWDIVSPTAPEISSPSYLDANNLSENTPAIEIDGHMSFPPIPYCLREIKLPHIETYTTSSSSMLSYFSSQQISQYDPRRRTSVMRTSTAQAFQMECCSPMQPQNANVLLYGYLQRSSWYQGLMSSVKMQINHSIAELVRALNDFQKKRVVDATAVFDVFKIDCAVELLEIMRNIGIFVDANGCIAEEKGLEQYGQHATLNRSEINATYSFMPQLMPSSIKQGLLSCQTRETQPTQLSYPVTLTPQMQSASFVSCYVDAPTLTPTVPRRSCGYNIHNMNSTSSLPTINVLHGMGGTSSNVAYYSTNKKKYHEIGHDIPSDHSHAIGGGDEEMNPLNIAYDVNGRKGQPFNYRPCY